MGLVDVLGSIGGALLGGGATGLVGIIVQRIADHKNKKLDIEAAREKMAHEVALRKADAEIMAQEWAARTKVAEVEAASRESVAEAQAFAASFNEPQMYSASVKPSKGQGWVFVFLDLLRGMVRPMLTVYLCVIVTLMYRHHLDIMREFGERISPEQAVDMVQKITGTILYLTTTCVLWWFGTRNKAKK